MEKGQMIQGYKLTNNLSSMDFNGACTHFATGGRQNITIFSFVLGNYGTHCWFKKQKTYGRYRETSQTKANVTQLTWNNKGNQFLAVGTSTGLVVVYDTQESYKSIFQTKGHQGDIKNIQWRPNSSQRFVTSCFDNQIIDWDIRSDRPINRYQFGQTIKIRDLKFNPFNPDIIAVQSSRRLELIDIRMGCQILASYEVQSNELHGIGVQWDPSNKDRIASAISKEINVFDISSHTFQFVDSLTHYALIKNFHWMKTKPTFFGIMCDKPEKNIFFYDIQDKNRLAYYYGGHQRPIDCWIMDQQQTILISASTQKQKPTKGVINNPNAGLLVAQYTENYFDPNQVKFNHPLTFNNDSQIAFCLNLQSAAKKSSNADLRKKGKPIQTSPHIYQFRDCVEWFQRDKQQQFPLSLKEEVLYLAKNYLLEGNNQKIAQNNSEVAAKIGKSYCAQMWKNLFLICFPEQDEPTIDVIYQRKMKLNTSIVDNRVILHGSKSQNMKPALKIDMNSILQWLVDEHNQLQTAALASICLLNQAPDYISEQFVDRVWNPYIQLLRSLELYQLAAESILLTKKQKYTQITNMDTKYNLTCGSCKLSVTKGECKCNLLCVLCEQRLNKKLVIWCKYCGHGGHAVEYQKWFKVDKNKQCPHGCGHQCFSTQS